MASEITSTSSHAFNETLNSRGSAANEQSAKQPLTATQQESIQPQATQADKKVAERLEPIEKLQEQASEDFTLEELQEVLDEINSTFYVQNRALKFQVHDQTEDLVVQVLNTKTDEVIRQYPSEEILNRRKRLMEGDTNSFSTKVY